MATYVMLAGMTVGGWYLRKIAEPLRQAGHEVYTPSYTGSAERSHLLTPETDLNTHILDVLQVFKYEALSNVVLVGKSYSGMVITAVAEQIPEKIQHLVYLDAAVPQNGQSLADIVGLALKPLEELTQTYGDGWRIPAYKSVDERLTDHPARTFYQSITIDNPAATRIPRTYIYCSAKAQDDLATIITAPAAQFAQAQRWNYFEIVSGHEPEQEKPDEVVAILLQLAEGKTSKQ